MALRTVVRLTPNRCTRSSSMGSLLPTGNSPPAMPPAICASSTAYSGVGFIELPDIGPSCHHDITMSSPIWAESRPATLFPDTLYAARRYLGRVHLFTRLNHAAPS